MKQYPTPAEAFDAYFAARIENPEEPYPGMPRYAGDTLDAYLRRSWGWSDPVVQRRYYQEKSKRDRVRNFVNKLKNG